jgi:hypothetical protein
MDNDNDKKIADSEINDLINNFVPPENMELIGILTIILPKKVSIVTGGDPFEEEVGPIDWNSNPDIYTHVFNTICGDPVQRGQLSTRLQEGLQNTFDDRRRFTNFFVRSENMAGGGGSCFYFCRRTPDAPGSAYPRPATAAEAQNEQIFHLTIHLGPENDARGNPILMHQNQSLNAIHLRHPTLGRERQLNLAPRLIRRIIDMNNPATDEYFIQLNPLVLQGTPPNALSRTYGPTITSTLNNFLENIDVPQALIPPDLIRRVDLVIDDKNFPALGGSRGGKKRKTKSKTKTKTKSKRKMKSKKNRKNK